MGGQRLRSSIPQLPRASTPLHACELVAARAVRTDRARIGRRQGGYLGCARTAHSCAVPVVTVNGRSTCEQRARSAPRLLFSRPTRAAAAAPAVNFVRARVGRHKTPRARLPLGKRALGLSASVALQA